MIYLMGQVAIGALSSGAGFAIRYLWDRKIRSAIKNRSMRRFWGFLDYPTDVYLPFTKEDNRGAAVGYGDLAALTELMSLVRDHFKSTRQVSVQTYQARFDENRNRNKNLIIIGGGKYNRVYREMISALNPPLHFFDTPNQSFQDIRNADRSIRYLPKYSLNGAVSYDIGLIVSAPNPFSSRERVVIVAGSHTYGSLAAMMFLSDPRTLKQLMGNDRFVLVVGSPIKQHSVVRVEQISSLVTW